MFFVLLSITFSYTVYNDLTYDDIKVILGKKMTGPFEEMTEKIFTETEQRQLFVTGHFYPFNKWLRTLDESVTDYRITDDLVEVCTTARQYVMFKLELAEGYSIKYKETFREEFVEPPSQLDRLVFLDQIEKPSEQFTVEIIFSITGSDCTDTPYQVFESTLTEIPLRTSLISKNDLDAVCSAKPQIVAIDINDIDKSKYKVQYTLSYENDETFHDASDIKIIESNDNAFVLSLYVTVTDKCEKAPLETKYNSEEKASFKIKLLADEILEGTCTNHPVKCIPVTDGTGGDCQECTEDKSKCKTCYDSENYEPNEDGGCKKIVSEAKCHVETEYPSGGDCAKCNDDNTKCLECVDGENYIPGANGECVHKCVNGKHHCQKCDDTGIICNECTANDLVKSGYECTCKGGFEFVNDVCVEEIKRITPSPTPNPEKLPDESSKTDETTKIQTITTEKITSVDPAKIYTENLDPSAVQLNIINKNNANLYVDASGASKIVVQLENDETKLTLSVRDSSTVQLKNGLSTTLINAGSSLNINGFSDDSATEITVGKITTSLLSSSLSLGTDKSLVIKELQVFGDKEVTADKVTIEKVKIEQGSQFKPSSTLKIQSIEIGIGSKLIVSDAIKDSNIIIHYNRPQGDENKIYPLILDVLSTAVPKSYTIKKTNLGTYLDEQDYILMVKKYPSNMDDNVKGVCTNWEKTYDSSDSPFTSVTCRYQENVYEDKKEGIMYNELQLVATNAKSKKNGLSGGAIAGIVIGCVAAVAIAAVLIWYFAFYRKSKVGASEDAEP